MFSFCSFPQKIKFTDSLSPVLNGQTATFISFYIDFFPGGETRSIRDGGGGGSDVFFGLKIYTLGIFWGQEICYVLF